MTEFVPRFYTMNPETDVFILDAQGLSEGMKVLLENPHDRAHISDRMEDWILDRALERNRWCVVSHIKIVGNELRFVGTYDDGSKRIRKYSVDEAWLAKKDSIAASLDTTTERYNNVCALIHEALREAAGPEPTLDPFKEYPELDEIAEETTKQIMGLDNRRSEMVEQYIMATVMDAIQVTISEGPSEDEKTTQLSEIVEKSTTRILGLL